MRIGLVYHQFVLRGGLEGYLVDFASRLQSKGHELHVVTAEMDAKVAEVLGAKVHHVPAIKGSSLLRMWQFERLASRMVPSMDLDVSLGFGRTTTHDLHRAGGGCHKVYSDLLSPLKRWGIKNQLELQLEKELYTSGRTKRFVVNSHQVAKQLHEAYGTPKELFSTIHTAVDTERFKPSNERDVLRRKICEQLRSDPARPVFLFVSLNHRRKGLDVLLDVWKEVDADLWIVGKELKAVDRAKVTSRGLQHKVFSIARQSDVAMLYKAADWFVHPTLYDACANTVLQSMACGLPGLISVKDGAIDLLQNGENGWLLEQPQDPASVLQSLQHSLKMSPEERAKMSQSARQTTLPLTWDAHIEKWLKVIAELE